MENHGENRAPKISILSCAFIKGYKTYGIRCKRRGKSQPYELSKTSQILA